MKLRLAGLLLGVALVGACGQKGQQPQTDAPVPDLKQLMAQKVQTSADVYWKAVQYISDEKGMHEIMPRNDAEWERTRQAAEQVGQYARQMMTPAYAQGRGQDWQEFAQGLSDVAGEAARAAEVKSTEKVLEMGGTMYNVCSACHEVYMPSPGGLAPTGVAESKGA